jgi:hypothetical protein
LIGRIRAVFGNASGEWDGLQRDQSPFGMAEAWLTLTGQLKGVSKEIPDRCQSGILYQRRESNPHIRRYTILSRARLPVPPLWQITTNQHGRHFVRAGTLAEAGLKWVANMTKV